MNWLARVDVDAKAALAHHIYDNYAWHKRIWEDCFEDAPDATRDFLTRIDRAERSFRIWILSRRRPLRPEWCSAGEFALKEIPPSFLSHRFYAFDLRANPTKCIGQRDSDGSLVLRRNERRTRGKRVPLVKPEELRAWLQRKGQVRCQDERTQAYVPGGFRIVEEYPLEITPMVESHFRRNEHRAYHGGVEFRGILEVTDREGFVRSYQSGIGSAKAFGFGLLLLAPMTLNNKDQNA